MTPKGWENSIKALDEEIYGAKMLGGADKLINIELCELYGCENAKELIDAIEACKSIGMSDEEINATLERSRTKKRGEENAE